MKHFILILLTTLIIPNVTNNGATVTIPIGVNVDITGDLILNSGNIDLSGNLNVSGDLVEKTNEIQFSDLKLIFQNLKGLFKKQGYEINWKEIEKQSLDQTINTLSMASPFSLEEKQILLETINLNERKKKLEEILSMYKLDNFNNKTIQ